MSLGEGYVVLYATIELQLFYIQINVSIQNKSKLV